jgi:hypothetical protein
MSATTSKGAASAAPVIAAFLATGGRVMLSPTGKLESRTDLAVIFHPATDSRLAGEAMRAARNYLAVERAHRGRIAAMVVRNGRQDANGWIVWEGR